MDANFGLLQQFFQAAQGQVRHGPQQFAKTYKCHSAALLDREFINRGGKIILPSSALDTMSQLDLVYPLSFELQKASAGNGPIQKSHCGVLEFSAEEGHMYVPFWMMRDMRVEEGEFVQLRTVTLPPGNFVKLQPESTAFIEISNPRAVLEQVLRNFSALGEGETICINYNHVDYWLRILEVRPKHPTGAISIVDTDVNVEFAAPLDYVEPVQSQQQDSEPVSGSAGAVVNGSKQIRVHAESDSDSEPEGSASTFKPFRSEGQTISGKPPKIRRRTSVVSSPPTAPTSRSRLGETHDSDTDDGDSQGQKFVPFSGKGHSLR